MNSSALNSVFNHPRGLFILFFTEMWERFSYYGMRAILVLFLVSEVTGDQFSGWGWDNQNVLALYGWYTMAVYLASVPGGWIADRWLGQKQAVMLGGWLLCAGHLVLVIHAVWAFYAGLVLIVAGVGFLKPNISTLVGELYPKNDSRRDSGFYIFYVGINLGAFLGMVVVAAVAEFYGWHIGFGLAGIGMLLGQLVFVLGRKTIKDVKEEGSGEQGVESLIEEIGKEGEEVNRETGMQKENEIGNQPLTKIEKDRILVMVLSFLIVIIFWGAYEQAGGLMTLFAFEKTDRFFMDFEIPAGAFQGAAAFYILIFGLVVAFFWEWWRRAGREASSLFKMAIGMMIMGTGFFFMSAASVEYETTGSAALYWLLLAYLFHVFGELCVSPVALSFITKLAPAKYASFMMGAYFAATGLGNKLAGMLGEYSTQAGEFTVFTGIAVFSIMAGVAVLIFLKPLKRLTHHAEDISS